MNEFSSARARLRDIADRAADVRPAWPYVGDTVAGAMVDQFETEGASGGAPWAPLSPPYLRWKIRNGFDPRKLRQTGAMRESLTSDPMAIEEYQPQQARFGSDDPKLHFHQSGTRFMPARPVLFMTPQLERDVARILVRYIVDGRVGGA